MATSVGCVLSSPDECHCDCHKNLNGIKVSHVIACCYICPHCERRIISSIYDLHVRSCNILPHSDDENLDRIVGGFDIYSD